LLEASSLLSASLEPHVVIDQLAQLLAKAAGAELVSLLVFEGESYRRICVYGPWLSPELLALFPLGETHVWTNLTPARRILERAEPTTGPITSAGLSVEIERALMGAAITTFTGLPLQHSGNIIGLAYLYSRNEPPRIDKATLALLQGLAVQAAAALEHARLHHTLKQHARTLEQKVASQTLALTERNRELQVLNEVLVAINESSTLEERLMAVARRLQELLSVEECSLYLLHEDETAVTVATSISGAAPTLLDPQQLVTGGALWRRFRSPPPAASPSPTDASPYVLPQQKSESVHSVLFPIFTHDRLAGFLLIGHLMQRDWNRKDGFWRTLCDQIGLAVQNSRLHRAAQVQAERLRTLLEIGRDLNSSLEIQDVLSRAVRAIGSNVADVHHCSISLFMDEQQLHTVSEWRNPDFSHAIPTEEQLAAQSAKESRVALDTQQPTMATDLWQEHQRGDRGNEQRDLRAVLCVPIMGKTGPLGLIHIHIFAVPRTFVAHEVELVGGIAAQVALAVENAHLVEEAQRHAAAAQARAQELDSFTYTVSHDLKAPLSNLKGFAEVLAEDYADGLDEQGRFCLDRITANAQIMAQMIDELLLLSRLDREERAVEPVDVNRVIVGVLLQLYPEIEERGVRMEVQRDMPTLAGQEIWLEQVFANLIGNAIKFIDDDNPDPCVQVGWKEHAAGALFWVRDNGVGIAAADQERVFELFARLHTLQRQGTGLGLPIVQRVVERANGRIWIESEPGQGSTFYFTWPALL
jgi:signal transduction histidine kinase